jgi:hypothetical protein
MRLNPFHALNMVGNFASWKIICLDSRKAMVKQQFFRKEPFIKKLKNHLEHLLQKN